MNYPTACYRLQFRGAMDFDRAALLVPYLARLGVSHLYASPLFTASPGSTHGYDVTDPHEIDPAIGGREGLDRLSAALKTAWAGAGAGHRAQSHGLLGGHALAARRAAPRDGQPLFPLFRHRSAAAERMRLPWLAAPFERMLAEGAFTVEDTAEGPVLAMRAGCGCRWPKPARSRRRAAATARRCGACTPSSPGGWSTGAPRSTTHQPPAVLQRHRPDRRPGRGRRRCSTTCTACCSTSWPTAPSTASASTTSTGWPIRRATLDRLRARVPDTPIWVEKILSGREVPAAEDWPVQGTTGYVAARAFSRLLTNGDGLDADRCRLSRRHRPHRPGRGGDLAMPATRS